MLLYTLLLLGVSLLPYAVGMAGILYLAGAFALGATFTVYAAWMLASDDEAVPMAAFRYSIWYLGLLFAVLLVDHYLPAVVR